MCIQYLSFLSMLQCIMWKSVLKIIPFLRYPGSNAKKEITPRRYFHIKNISFRTKNVWFGIHICDRTKNNGFQTKSIGFHTKYVIGQKNNGVRTKNICFRTKNVWFGIRISERTKNNGFRTKHVVTRPLDATILTSKKHQ